jgi:uridylate kinase
MAYLMAGDEPQPAESGDGKPKFERVVVKLSGEAFADTSVGFGLDYGKIDGVARQLVEVLDLGVQVAVVVGGGNIVRGSAAEAAGMDRARADYMGMLGTVMNCLALEKGRIVIFGAGMGAPYFSTDTTAAQRSLEIGAEAILMAKNGVDGVYDADPKKHPEARKFLWIDYLEAIGRELRVMDTTALSLCKDHDLPIIVFDLLTEGNIRRAVCGEPIGTVVGPNDAFEADETQRGEQR